MANIEIKYRIGYCALTQEDYCDQCHTSAADYLGCKMFDEGEHDEMTIPFGDCVHATFKHLYKGMTVKRYELEPYTDSYNPHLECMLLHAGGKVYECEKVTLDGLTVYDAEAAEEEYAVTVPDYQEDK